MSQDEQKQFDYLRDQLTSANQKIDEVRSLFLSALVKSNTEARLYRGLFWSLLVLSAMATIVHLLRN
jgi:hypothetical protein